MVSKTNNPSSGSNGAHDIEALREELNRFIAALARLQANVDIDQNAAIIALRSDMEKLIRMVSQSNSERELAVAGLVNLDNVLQNGLTTLLAQLLPLRDLTVYRDPLKEGPTARLLYLQLAHRRPEWASAGSLGITELGVKFIGEVVVPLGPDSVSNDEPLSAFEAV